MVIETTQPQCFRLIYSKPEQNGLSPFSDKAIFPPSVLDAIISQYHDQKLPVPLIFKLTNSSNNISAFVGVKEFTSAENTLILPQYVESSLKLSDPQDQLLHVELVPNIPKGTSLQLKPIYNYTKIIKDWKWFLQSKLNNAYTTLSKDQLLFISNDLYDEFLPENDLTNPAFFKILVSDLEPKELGTICIVDTDIDLDINQSITAINDGIDEPTQDIIDVPLDESVHLNVNKFNSSNKYKFKIPKNSKSISAQVNVNDVSKDINNVDLIASFDEYICENEFVYSTLISKNINSSSNSKSLSINLISEESKDYIFFKFMIWGENDTTITFNVSQNSLGLDFESDSIEIDHDMYKCENCFNLVPKQSARLHEIHCFRRKKCTECGSIEVLPTHWHCLDNHSEKFFGNSPLMLQRHNYIFHSDFNCKCGAEYSSVGELARHKASDCDFKLHECRFCHLILPRGKATPEDVFYDLSHHESDCGNKTLDCFKCHKIVKQRNFESHLLLHEKKRLEIPKPKKCGNVNCISTSNINEFNLCDLCYGQIYSGSNTPANLQNKIERKYVIQLTRGCRNTWCSNKECISSGLSKPEPITEVIPHIQKTLLTLIPYLPSNIFNQPNGLESIYFFCVSESVMKKKKYVDFLFDVGEYEYEWICKSSSHASDEKSMLIWLKDNAVKINETA